MTSEVAYRRCPARRPADRGGQRCIRRKDHPGLHLAWVRTNPLKLQLVQFAVTAEEEGDGGMGPL